MRYSFVLNLRWLEPLILETKVVEGFAQDVAMPSDTAPMSLLAPKGLVQKIVRQLAY